MVKASAEGMRFGGVERSPCPPVGLDHVWFVSADGKYGRYGKYGRMGGIGKYGRMDARMSLAVLIP